MVNRANVIGCGLTGKESLYLLLFLRQLGDTFFFVKAVGLVYQRGAPFWACLPHPLEGSKWIHVKPTSESLPSPITRQVGEQVK